MKIEWNKVTWYSKIFALALFVALPFAGFWFGVRYGVSRQYMADILTNLKNASSSVFLPASQSENAYYENVSEWQTDQNNSGWSIAYPIDFPLTLADNNNYSVTPLDNWRWGNPGGPGFQPFALTIPKVFEPQTNFGDAKLTVGMSSDAAAVAQCLIQDPTGLLLAPTSSVAINGTGFTVFHSSDAGAGNFYETTSYRTLRVGQCWAIEYTIHSSNIGVYPPEYGLKPFNEAKLHDALDRIAGTFKFL